MVACCDVQLLNMILGPRLQKQSLANVSDNQMPSEGADGGLLIQLVQLIQHKPRT